MSQDLIERLQSQDPEARAAAARDAGRADAETATAVMTPLVTLLADGEQALDERSVAAHARRALRALADNPDDAVHGVHRGRLERRHPIEAVLETPTFSGAAQRAIIETGGAPRWTADGPQLRIYAVVSVSAALGLAERWRLGALDGAAPPLSVAAPSKSLARSWAQSQGERVGLVVHADVLLDELPDPELRPFDDASTALALTDDEWTRLIARQAHARTTVTAGFCATDSPAAFWQPFFTPRGIDRVVADFGDRATWAVETIIEGTNDHYDVSHDDAVDWSRAWLTGLANAVAARAEGDEDRFAKVVDTANRDMRDIYS